MMNHPLAHQSIQSSCSVRLDTLVSKINTVVPNGKNALIIFDFQKYMQTKGSSENHQVNNLKVVTDFAKFLGPLSFLEVKKQGQILTYLDTKVKPLEQDPEKKWVTTWNHYLNRIKLFFRWFYNHYSQRKDNDLQDSEDWVTPDFCRIKTKKTKRLSPYSENEIWERDEILTLVKHEPFIRNKAILTLMWDLNARPHEITLIHLVCVLFSETS